MQHAPFSYNLSLRWWKYNVNYELWMWFDENARPYEYLTQNEGAD